MNYAQLQQAILDDTHKLQYTGATIQRMIQQAEALISSRLEAYNFLGQLLDANRVSVNSSNYTLPTKLIHLRYVRINGLPLDKVDESSAYMQRDLTSPLVYAQRAAQIIIAGNPGTGTAIDIDYMGMPATLSDLAPTNTLLDDVPQLYIDATMVYVYRRAKDFEAASDAMQNVVQMCRELNRKSKKLLGGAQAMPVYNTQFRSSY